MAKARRQKAAAKNSAGNSTTRGRRVTRSMSESRSNDDRESRYAMRALSAIVRQRKRQTAKRQMAKGRPTAVAGRSSYDARTAAAGPWSSSEEETDAAPPLNIVIAPSAMEPRAWKKRSRAVADGPSAGLQRDASSVEIVDCDAPPVEIIEIVDEPEEVASEPDVAPTKGGGQPAEAQPAAESGQGDGATLTAPPTDPSLAPASVDQCQTATSQDVGAPQPPSTTPPPMPFQ